MNLRKIFILIAVVMLWPAGRASAVIQVKMPVSKIYGTSKAVYIGTVTGVTAANRLVDVKITGSLKGESPGVAGLVVKLQNCQLSFDMAALAIDVMGELGVLYEHSKYERELGFWQAYSMFSLGLIIGGGTAQIQKNIIAERGLGLPREPKQAKA